MKFLFSKECVRAADSQTYQRIYLLLNCFPLEMLVVSIAIWPIDNLHFLWSWEFHKDLLLEPCF